ncbi:C/D box methylation guide ribonucleoprotein complex aNOP56 subunit [Infirmifilum uzonense]|uniref:C/D box methylation guide ribonucleoprotein complex aNOP56 subunit n=1 Tax=Infirmifilum uzonense TaxID=1550241 RepID=A0A0F7CLD0_9CREN|nr:C/D box methylation guide ribonucleoprotein complex aNOP56 subunit [Infirmifilum uzonense]AKG39196.1 C/D box methylation guide ribonucleoprotein complex aNOP56 subunit [Infirmifilum uzonense]
MSVLYLFPSPFALYLLNENAEPIKYYQMYQAPDLASIANYLYELEQGRLSENALKFIMESTKTGDTIIVEDEDLGRFLSSNLRNIKVEHSPNNTVFARAREKIVVLVEKTLGIKEDEYYKILRDAALHLARLKVKEVAEKRDLSIAQAINALDDVNKTINLFASRVREWYSLHFPELDSLVEEHEDYFKIVSNAGFREKITKESLVKLGIKEELANKIVDAASKSMGADLTEFDLEAIRLISDTGLRLYIVRRSLEKYIDEAMYEVAPNVRGLVGSLLGARLIALAGGLEKLAKLPASTIQVLGAEKALFRALRYGAKPPKHGVIFQHPLIHKSPRWQRGKIARALAAKLAIAARIDAFSGEYRADELREDLEKRVDEIKKLYEKPPLKKESEKPRRVKKGKKHWKGDRR